MFDSIPPLHRYVPIILRQTFSRQTLERIPEPAAVTDQPEHVLQYDQVMSTKLAIAYSVALEVIYRARKRPLGGAAIDLACGPGHFSLHLAKYLQLNSLLGVDLSEPMIEIAIRNAQGQGKLDSTFRVDDVSKMKVVDNNQFDLCTFTDAAHHMPDLETVTHVLCEMDRITKPEGLVFLMDLVRFKTAEVTNRYIELLGKDYCKRNLSAFYSDFRQSMFAAWSVDELRHAAPIHTKRQWVQLNPIGLPTIQILLGLPHGQRTHRIRSGLPWTKNDHPLVKRLRIEWNIMRASLKWGCARYLTTAP